MAGEVVAQALIGTEVGIAGGELADDQAGDLDLARLFVLGVDAGIADHREGLDQDLTGVRRVGQGFLVAADGGVKDDLGSRGDADRSEGGAVVDHAVGEGQPGQTRGRIGGGMGVWGMGRRGRALVGHLKD